MALKISPEDAARVVAIVTNHPTGATVNDIIAGLPDRPPRRTVHDWVTELVEAKVLTVDSSARAHRFFASPDAAELLQRALRHNSTASSAIVNVAVATSTPGPVVTDATPTLGSNVQTAAPEPPLGRAAEPAPRSRRTPLLIAIGVIALLAANVGVWRFLATKAPGGVAQKAEDGGQKAGGPGVRSQDGRTQETVAQKTEGSGQKADDRRDAGQTLNTQVQPGAVSRPLADASVVGVNSSAVNVGGVTPSQVAGASSQVAVGSKTADREKAGTAVSPSTSDTSNAAPAAVAPRSETNVGAVPSPRDSTTAPSSMPLTPAPSVDQLAGGSVDRSDQPVNRSTGAPTASVSDQSSASRPSSFEPPTVLGPPPSDAAATAAPSNPHPITNNSAAPVAALPPYPAAAGAYVLINGGWIPLPRNNGRVIAHSPTLAESDKYLQQLDDFDAGKTMTRPMLVAAYLTFDGKEPVPVVPAKDLVLVYLAPSSAALPVSSVGPAKEEAAPGPNNQPPTTNNSATNVAVELAPTTTLKNGTRQAPLYILGEKPPGFGPKRVPATEERVAPDITVLRCLAVPPGRYALLCGPQSYEVILN